MFEEKEIIIDNLKVNYKIAGQGEPVLIIHGWGGSSDSWVKVQENIAKNNFKVVCPDLPGFGKSPNPPVSWGIDDYINFISDFVKEVGLEKFFLVGHSFGGGLATKFTALYPKKVKALVLCDAAVVRSNKKLNFRQKVAYALTKNSYAIFSNSFFKRTVYPWAQKVVYKIAGTHDYYLAKGTMKETFQKISSEDLSKFAIQIKVPTLVIWGRQDKTLPIEDGIALKRLIPNSKAEFLEDVDHSPHRKKPEELSNIIINFIRANS